MKRGDDVTFVGLKTQHDLISERVQAANKNGDIIDVDDDEEQQQDHTKDDEANKKKKNDEHVGESSSDSNSSDDQRRSPTEDEKAMLKCEESCTDEYEHESAQEGIDNEEVDNEKAEKADVMSHRLLQLYESEAKEAEHTCPQCDKRIQGQDDSMTCTVCPRVYHNECLENEFNIVASDIMDNETFVCPMCKNLHGGKRSRSDDSDYVDDEDEAESEGESSD